MIERQHFCLVNLDVLFHKADLIVTSVFRAAATADKSEEDQKEQHGKNN